MSLSRNRLVKLNIKDSPKLKSFVSDLYEEAFPKSERIPWWIMNILLSRSKVECLAYFDGERFCGFTYSIVLDDIYFIYYLAVSSTHRGKGYGSEILSMIKAYCGDKAVVLNMEPLDEDADNIAQRRRRFDFYTRNGFYDTGFDVYEIGGRFTVMSSVPKLRVKAYKRIFRYLSFGLWNVKVEKNKK